MHSSQEISTAFRVVRGPTGQWEVVEEGHDETLARFEAPQAALSYACNLAASTSGSLVVVFDEPSRLPGRRTTAPMRGSKSSPVPMTFSS